MRVDTNARVKNFRPDAGNPTDTVCKNSLFGDACSRAAERTWASLAGTGPRSTAQTDLGFALGHELQSNRAVPDFPSRGASTPYVHCALTAGTKPMVKRPHFGRTKPVTVA